MRFRSFQKRAPRSSFVRQRKQPIRYKVMLQKNGTEMLDVRLPLTDELRVINDEFISSFLVQSSAQFNIF